MNNIKIKCIMLSPNEFFVRYHIDSKRYNDFTNQIISLDTLFDELSGYNKNGIIYLNNILEMYDINNNLINMDETYDLLSSLIVANKMIDNKLSIILV